jgi:3-deoxy-D-manno-octulosonate 8-phosphate phosphatase (KDO 8-P phosphatase)
MNYKELLKNINTFVLDYDGVLTDGKVILREEGEPLRTANVRDGYAIQLAVKRGYRVVIISGGRSNSVINRMRSLNVQDIFLGIEKKEEVLKDYMIKHGLSKENILYMGDDIPDYYVMQMAGIASCPADASEEIKAISHYISAYKGGTGCVRDIIEQVLKVQGNWMNHDAFSW